MRKPNSISCDPASVRADYVSFLQKDFMKGRHAGKNLCLFFDGHSESIPGVDMGKEAYVEKRDGRGNFVLK